MPDTYSISLTRGDTYQLGVIWEDSEGDPIDIASARLQVRKSVTSASTLLSVTDADDALSISANTVSITLEPEQTDDLANGVYDLEVTSDGGQVKTLIAGRFNVRKDVTR